MAENPNLYNLEKAQEEATKMQELVGENPTAEKYSEVEKQADKFVYGIVKSEKIDQEQTHLNQEQKYAIERMIQLLSQGNFGMLPAFEKKFNISNYLNFPEVQQAIKKGITKVLIEGDIEKVTKAKVFFNLPDDLINSLDNREAAKEGFIKKLLR